MAKVIFEFNSPESMEYQGKDVTGSFKPSGLFPPAPLK